ncbi:hypothetical protein ACIGO6_39725 [Streptomyces sp. NPDC053750]|uniref:hypothetical protein n=1 Tax=Streptomyces sp. NPDC053750 TaxID=3365714 RepID=UPI0037D5C07C
MGLVLGAPPRPRGCSSQGRRRIGDLRVLPLLVAPTTFGQGVLDFVGQLASGINDVGR